MREIANETPRWTRAPEAWPSVRARGAPGAARPIRAGRAPALPLLLVVALAALAAPDAPASAGDASQAKPGDPKSTGAKPEARAPSKGGQTVEFEVGGETVRAYLALPASISARGGAVVAHEWWGLNDQIRGVADRLAGEGYASIVPDLYRGEVAEDPEKAHELMRGLQEGRATDILRAAASYLQRTEEAAGTKAAVIGFCMGGRLALLAAIGGREVAGAVMFYGQPVVEKERLGPLSVPVLGLFGAEDRGISVSDVRAFESAAKAAGKQVETHLYPGAGHAFFNETRPSYNRDAAADAWKRTLAFLDRTLRD